MNGAISFKSDSFSWDLKITLRLYNGLLLKYSVSSEGGFSPVHISSWLGYSESAIASKPNEHPMGVIVGLTADETKLSVRPILPTNIACQRRDAFKHNSGNRVSGGDRSVV